MSPQAHGVPQQKDSVLVGREQQGEALASSKAEQMVGTDMYENGVRNTTSSSAEATNFGQSDIVRRLWIKCDIH